MEHFYFVTCGTVIGDISGSTLENKFIKEKPACLIPPHSHFTDETVLTCAVAVALQATLPRLSPGEMMSFASDRSAVSRALIEEVIKRKIHENWLAPGNTIPVRPATLQSLKPEPRKSNDQN